MKRLLVTPEFKLFTVVGTVVLLIGALSQLGSNKVQTKPVAAPSTISDTSSVKTANPS